MIAIFGLKNCDTCRKALKWLQGEGLAYTFNDVRNDGLARDDLILWAAAAGWETLLNRRSTTWRQLPPSDRENIDESKAMALLQANPTLLKRPVMVHGAVCTVGFGAAQQAAIQSGP